MSDWIPLTSSMIRAARHHAASSVLEVEFVNGVVWSYPGVNEDVFLSLIDAPSPGKYFHEHVRDLPDATPTSKLSPLPPPSQDGDAETEPGSGVGDSPPQTPAPLPPGLIASGVVQTLWNGRIAVVVSECVKLSPEFLAWISENADYDMSTDSWVLP